MRDGATLRQIWSQVAFRWSQLDPFQRHVFKLGALGFALAMLFALLALFFAVRHPSGAGPRSTRPAEGAEVRK